MNRRLGHEGAGLESTDADTMMDSVVLNKGTDEQLQCEGYKNCGWRRALYILLIVLTLGFIVLLMYWKPAWKIKLTKVRCTLKEADTVILKDINGETFHSQVIIQPVKDGVQTYGDYIREPGPWLLYRLGDSYADTECQEGADANTALTQKCQLVLRYFDHQRVRYMWDKEYKYFRRLMGLDTGDTTIAVVHDKYGQGLSDVEQSYRQQLYGDNIIEVEVNSYMKLLIEEILNPFYIFQVASIILWSVDKYYVYAACIFIISAISIGVELYETRKQSETLRDMVSAVCTTIEVVKAGGEVAEMPTTALVPGDVVIIPAKGCTMSCDAVLLSGNAIVNESMLTGESVPVTKTPLNQSEAHEIFSPDAHKRHVLFCGTEVIQTRFYGDQKVKAVVIRTGFSTAKGELVRSILYPKPIGFKFYQDSLKFIACLGLFAVVGTTYSVITLLGQQESVQRVVIRALDIITIIVPPALPAAMTVGTVYAQSRLKKQKIFCISPPRINICGKLKCICFDKTGTLTEEGLDLWGIVPVDHSTFQPIARTARDLSPRGPLMIAMATCHSLTRIDGEINGDPLDLKMFEATNWILEEPGDETDQFDTLIPTIVRPPDSLPALSQQFDLSVTFQTLEEPGSDSSRFDTLAPTVVRPTDNYMQPEAPFEVGIVRQFTFSSSLQRMAVITRILGAKHMEIFAKGAPEKIVSLCKPDTLPEDFHRVLQMYTARGFRVIAFAYKPLDAKLTWHQSQRIARDTLECDLKFLGLLVMENALKPETTPIIRELISANIRTVMVTGDNMLTAVSVARQCHMVPGRDPVILVSAVPPEGNTAAQIQWEMAEGSEQNGEVSLTMQTIGQAQADASELHEAINIDQDEHTQQRYHFAITGKSFGVVRTYFPELMSKLCVRGTVFARMSPDQKTQLVEYLQSLGYGVGMCGDGANDCGALKAAHAGVSLSEAEASVASPFTSKTPNITCIPTVIKEGRAALVTSFGVFKYMALYSFIQFVSVLILYTKGTNLTDWMFLYTDLLITTTVAVFMGYTGAYEHLVPRRPSGSLLGPTTIFSIFIQISLVIIFQSVGYVYLTEQPWFTPAQPHMPGRDVNQSYETTVIFFISAFQYIMLAFCFSRGPPYRKPIWTNLFFMVSLIILTALTIFIVLYPLKFIAKLLLLEVPPSFFFRFSLLGLVTINFLLAVLIETYVVPSKTIAKCFNKIRGKKLFKNKYKLIEMELQGHPEWPPIGGVTRAEVQSDCTFIPSTDTNR